MERGSILTLENKTFFCFGGARSHDIKDGILDPNNFVNKDDFQDEVRKWQKQQKIFRLRGISWWPQELPTEKEILDATNILQNHLKNGKIDYLITHCADSQTLYYISEIKNTLMLPDICTDAIQSFKNICSFKHHFCGHYHIDEDFYPINKTPTTILYNRVYEL